MCSESRDLFKFWKISDNISLTVQDREILCTIRPGLERHLAIDVAGQRSQGVAEWAGALL